MALGADRSTVLRLVIRQGLMLTAIGVALGLAAGAAGAQVLRSLLFGVSALDPVRSAARRSSSGRRARGQLPPRAPAARVDPMWRCAQSKIAEMSRLNGDKSRHQINRKRVVLRRAKIKKLVAEAKAKGAESTPSTAKDAEK